MHERSPYHDGIDFRILAESYPPLKQFLFVTTKGVSSIDFRNEDAQRTLTRALLFRDFGLTLESLPNDRLCPPVPNRLDYVLWIQDVIERTTEALEKSEPIIGVDIGTGASAIYPLLACKLNGDWKMIGTDEPVPDLDQKSLSSAEENVTSNNMQSRLTIWRSKPGANVFAPIFAKLDQEFTFTMCNPPFYSTYSEAVNSPVVKEFDPFAVCTGAEVEMVTEGGEVEFVRRMIMESTELRERCRWYTSLLGKSSSVAALVEILKAQKIDNYGVTELVQSHTKRWVIFWSLGDIRLPDSLARITRGLFVGYMPLPNTLVQVISNKTKSELIDSALRILGTLPAVRWTQPLSEGLDQNASFLVMATANCWSRSARRKGGTFSKEGPVVLTCRLTVTSEATAGIAMACQWVRGRDRELFESFWSHVSRKITDKL